MASSGKSAARMTGVSRRNPGTARQSVRSRHKAAPRPATLSRTQSGHQGVQPAIPARPQPNLQYQAAIKNFEMGVRAFQKQNYGKAAEIFEKLVDGETREVAERAQVHLRLCRQRSGRPARPPKSAEEYYTLGVACMNARQYGLAVEHLSKADKLQPHQDYIHYALAVSHSQDGNPEAALAHLQTAFTLRPENRIHARRDEDFQGLATDPRFRCLVYPAETP